MQPGITIAAVLSSVSFLMYGASLLGSPSADLLGRMRRGGVIYYSLALANRMVICRHAKRLLHSAVHDGRPRAARTGWKHSRPAVP